MFTGLSAFPLTPLRDDAVDHDALAAIVRRLVAAGVDSITVLGSTGSYAYLDRAERQAAIATAVEHAGGVPVFAGVGALRTKHVLEHASDAQDAGARALLVAPVSYQPLTAADVLGLFTDVVEHADLPVIVYDNPGTTRFAFDDALYARLADLPGIASIKIPGIADATAAQERLRELRALLPERITIGISGDAHAARGLAAGCDAWYSVIAGTIAPPMVALTRAALAGDHDAAAAASARLQPLWDLFAEHGSLRVTAAIAEHLGMATRSCLPRPILGLDDEQRRRVHAVVAELELEP
ncbi:4-hydroxy-tetrahydrodipicolinate synthase [Agrococcus sp. UYP33]